MLELYHIPTLDHDSPALYWSDGAGKAQTLLYGAYMEHSAHVASQIASHGVQRGERVAILGAGTPQMAVVLLACLRAGFVAVPLSPRFPAETVTELLRLTGARMLLYDDTTKVVSIDAATKAGIPSVVLSAQLDREKNGNTDKNLDTDKNVCATKDSIFDRNLFADALGNDATILCTSGSTGLPKALVHTVGNHYWSAMGSAANIPFGEGDCWLLSLPMYHVGGYGVFFRALAGGASVAFPTYHSFDAGALVQTLDRFPITHCSFVATQLFHALQSTAAVERLQRLRSIVLGGGAIPHSLIQSALDKGLRIYTSYGCTEMASQITTASSPAPSEVFASGRLLPFRELALADDGEILVRGRTLAVARLSTKGKESITSSDGWFHTKDLGTCDAEGRLTVFGRKDNMFISGGENIHPETIEHALCEHPSVVQAIVVPVPNEKYGERPVAFVQFAHNLTLSEERLQELRQIAEQRLPRFALPDAFFSFPPEILAGGLKPSRAALKYHAQKLMLSLRDDG
ncbi:MAG: o-succinylbenzoate--CoA ligase [Candidatus Kapabacteria bacterium]|nr:o-succinylbenzoate--CoA ligase [Candidatus Kapabacteria bacterium]